MPSCRYCDDSFEDEDVYLSHLEADHYDELSRIDRRRVDQQSTSSSTSQPLIYGAVILLVIGIAGFLLFNPLGGNGTDEAPSAPPTPHNLGAVHYHGTINMTVDGDRVDFTADKYKRPQENPAFHFEGVNDRRWHVHAQGVTLHYAMATLDIKVIPTEVIYDGVVYREEDPGIEIIIEVNDESVDPRTYVLSDGDHVHIAVYTN